MVNNQGGTRLRSLSRRSAKFRPGLPMACRSFNMSFRFCKTIFHTAVVERGNDDHQRIVIVQFQTLVCYHDPMTDDFILDKVSITKLNKSVESVDMALTFTAIEVGPFVHSDSTHRLFKYTFGLHLGGLKLSASSLVGAASVYIKEARTPKEAVERVRELVVEFETAVEQENEEIG
jgi:hypothetical protein